MLGLGLGWVRVKGEGEGYLWWNSTKQKPHGVFVYRSSPMITRFSSPLREKSS